MSSVGKLYHDWLVFPKALYFVFNVSNYAMHSHQNLLFRERLALTTKELSGTFSMLVLSFIGSIYWTWLADKSGRFKMINGLATTIFALSWLAAFMDPNWLVTKDERMLLVYAVIGMTSFFSSALFPIIDAVVMSLLSSVPGFNKDMFGRQRMWGAIGHCGATYISDFIFTKLGLEPLKYMVLGSGILLFLVITLMIPNSLSLEVGHHHHHAPAKKDDKQASSNDAAVTVSKDAAATPAVTKTSDPVWFLLTSPSFLFFLLFIFVSGVTRSQMTNFGNQFIITVFQRKYYVSMLATVRLFSEVSVYYFNKDLSVFLGPYWMLILSQLAAVVRSVGYGLTPTSTEGMSYLLGIPWELMKGLNSGLVTAGAVRIASDMAPPGGASSAQGLFTGVFVGLANLFGGQLARKLLDLAPPGTSEVDSLGGLFLQTGGCLFVFLLCFIAKYALVDKVILQGNKGGNKK